MTKDFTNTLDWHVYREESLKTGGLGPRRVEIWPLLLHARKPQDEEAHPIPPAHPDERQIQLDTDRSFVLYPVGEPFASRVSLCSEYNSSSFADPLLEKESLKRQLHELIVSVFRKRPRLSYFQGYHDIVSVLFLTLPPEMQFCCTEKLSLQRVRDSMGSTLEPVLGLLRVMSRLLRLADPPLSSLLEQISPLPYYALSNLLTLFAHDMPCLPLIQHVFDYLLCRPPIMVVYLASAILLSRKAEIERLEEAGEEGMVHSLLSGLPNIYDEDAGSDKTNTLADVYIPLEGEATVAAADDESDSLEVTPLDDRNSVGEAESKPPEDSGENAAGKDEKRSEEDKVEVHPATEPVDEKEPLEEIKELVEELSLSNDVDTTSTDEAQEPYLRLMRPRVSLSSLLVAADELYAKYPPTHRDISLTSIMGPQSVVFTWSESLSEMPDDDEAERMVEKPELIVRPYTEPHTEKSESEPGREKHKQRRTRGTFLGGRVEKRTVVAGAVLTIGVAVAVYGVRTRSLNGTSMGKDGVKDWHTMGMWLGGSLMSAGERIFGAKKP
ncbi:GTPase-activating protein gyp8, variant 2 [Pleurotus ostreatus]|nr:GTPase-activating protein gyp8, variant 2 [Pleurotus ostreatus]